MKKADYLRMADPVTPGDENPPVTPPLPEDESAPVEGNPEKPTKP